jgi:Bacterial PH domain
MTDLSGLPADPDQPVRHRSPVLLTVRPHRIAIYASVAAVLIVAVMVFVAIRLRSSDTGVIFRASDAMAMVGLGLLFAAGLMLTARSRLRVDATGMWVRNVFGERFVAWPLIQRVAFPEGSVWAQLELADDEIVSVMAIQALDRSRAVEALKRVRALHAQYAPKPPTRANGTDRQFKVTDPARPLGRLEQIDMIKAAQGKGKRYRPHA